MSVLRGKIAEAEQMHRDTCKGIDTQCDEDIKAIEARRETDKAVAADAMVKEIVGKFI